MNGAFQILRGDYDAVVFKNIYLRHSLKNEKTNAFSRCMTGKNEINLPAIMNNDY